MIAVVIVWALVLRMSPGLALTTLAVAAFVVDRYDPSLLDRILVPRAPSGLVSGRR